MNDISPQNVCCSPISHRARSHSVPPPDLNCMKALQSFFAAYCFAGGRISRDTITSESSLQVLLASDGTSAHKIEGSVNWQLMVSVCCNNNNTVHLSYAHQRPERSHDTY